MRKLNLLDKVAKITKSEITGRSILITVAEDIEQLAIRATNPRRQAEVWSVARYLRTLAVEAQDE